jgi:signal peptidase I
VKTLLRIVGWLLALLIVAALGLRLFVFDVTANESADMFPSVGRGSWLIVNRLAKPKRGDLVMMKKDEGSHWIIRRVIALPGEKVTLVGGRPVAGGKEAKQQELRTITAAGHTLEIVREQLEGRSYQILLDRQGERRDVAEQAVSDGYWVLADNRDHAEDSRGFGVIKKEWIRGVVWLAVTDGEGP